MLQEATMASSSSSSIPLFDSCKKRKRMPKLFALHSFAENPIQPAGAFRDNIRAFLRDRAEVEDYSVDGMATWCTLLVSETKNFVVPLYTIEEDVKNSPQHFCDHCRCTGWSHHFLSKRKYHIIIPVDEEWNRPLQDGVFDLQSHLLYGLLHCNGYGHLLCINGIEGGSRFLCGREIMDLWDRICTALRVRKVTVEDVSKKYSMDLRLLHGVAYGQSWFGRWDYKYCHGNFGVSEHNYHRAVELLRSLSLNKVIRDFMDTSKYLDIKQIISYYKDLSDTQLSTVSELLSFMLAVKKQAHVQRKLCTNDVPAAYFSRSSTRTMIPQRKHPMKAKSAKCRKFSVVVANMDSRWPRRRLEYAADVVVEALKESKANNRAGMTRQDVRDAARVHIGDTGLLDYVLKSMNNVIVGNYVIQRAVNPSNRVLEYTIQEFHGNCSSTSQTETEVDSELISQPRKAAGADVCCDLAYLYASVLLEYPEEETVEVATRVILDTKHFVKEWPFSDDADQMLRFICRVMPGLSVSSKTDLAKEFPLSELVVLPLHATFAELKQAAEAAFRDTYFIMEEFVVTDIESAEEISDAEVLFGVFESGGDVWVRGYGMALENEMRYEGGADNWTVRCVCGAHDDDGERMVACDICEVWQHTRCIGIEDANAVPPLFVCAKCCASLVPQKANLSCGFDAPDSHLFYPVQDFATDFLI